MFYANIPSNFLFIGAIILISGIIALTILQCLLIGRLKKSLFTFLSVMFYPRHELSDTENKIKVVGNYLTIVGAGVVLISGFIMWLSN